MTNDLKKAENSFDHGQIPGVKIVSGHGGLPMVRLTSKDGAVVAVYLHGGHVASWKTPDGRERIFMSKNSNFTPGTAIRGGIPVVFPQFSKDGNLPQHGFLRIGNWELLDSCIGDESHILLGIKANDETRTLWPFDFAVTLKISLLSGRLMLEPTVENTGSAEFKFAFAFHSYFQVSDIQRVLIGGLRGTKYLDAVKGLPQETETEEFLRIDREIDRVYAGAPNRVVLKDADTELCITKRNMSDIVIWNPWVDKSAKLPDFGADEFNNMVCIETGNMRTLSTLPPGATWSGVTVFNS